MRHLDEWAVKVGFPVIAGLMAAGLSAAVVQTYVTITHDKGPGGFTPNAVPFAESAATPTTTVAPSADEPTTTTLPAAGQPVVTAATPTTASTASTRTRASTSPTTARAAVVTTTSTTVEVHGHSGDTPGSGRSSTNGPGSGDD